MNPSFIQLTQLPDIRNHKFQITPALQSGSLRSEKTWGKITPVSRVKSPQAKPFHFRPFIGGYDYNLIYNDRFAAPPLYQC